MTKMTRKLTYTEIEAIIIRVTKNPDIFVMVFTHPEKQENPCPVMIATMK